MSSSSVARLLYDDFKPLETITIKAPLPIEKKELMCYNTVVASTLFMGNKLGKEISSEKTERANKSQMPYVEIKTAYLYPSPVYMSINADCN